MANAVLICHHGRVFSNAFQHLGRTLSAVVTKRLHRFLKLADFSFFAFSHTIESLSLNADEILDLTVHKFEGASFSAFRTARNKKRSMPRDIDIVLK